MPRTPLTTFATMMLVIKLAPGRFTPGKMKGKAFGGARTLRHNTKGKSSYGIRKYGGEILVWEGTKRFESPTFGRTKGPEHFPSATTAARWIVRRSK